MGAHTKDIHPPAVCPRPKSFDHKIKVERDPSPELLMSNTEKGPPWAADLLAHKKRIDAKLNILKTDLINEILTQCYR